MVVDTRDGNPFNLHYKNLVMRTARRGATAAHLTLEQLKELQQLMATASFTVEGAAARFNVPTQKIKRYVKMFNEGWNPAD
jgi:DNA-binding GntR family transcriptional regulator